MVWWPAVITGNHCQVYRALITLLFLLFLLFVSVASCAEASIPAWTTDTDEGRQVHLYFFWSKTCPHCQVALPAMQDLEVSHPWLQLHSYEITESHENAERYAAMAGYLGEDARVVPAFFVCGQFLQGFDASGGRVQEILDRALACRTGSEAITVAPTVTRLPLLGDIAPDQFSLPVLTLLLAGLDAFNPCAFFVLLFLLSLLVHTRSRARMLLVGGVFVFFSGLVYFLFMAAWLNLFLVISSVTWVTSAAGVVALVIGGLNTKDFFAFGQGPSLSMSGASRSGLFERMRRLLATERLPMMLVGTVLLALAANSYELLCTAGFPMVYTRILTLESLPSAVYYGYLLFYNLIYVVPLLVIVLLFSATLGRHKLSERQGRALKLLSGLMMLGLGGLLLFSPAALSRVWVGGGLLAAASLLTWLLSRYAASK